MSQWKLETPTIFSLGWGLGARGTGLKCFNYFYLLIHVAPSAMPLNTKPVHTSISESPPPATIGTNNPQAQIIEKCSKLEDDVSSVYKYT